MISILSALAKPYIVNIFRDRRVSRAAMQLVDMTRLARTRALGRGTPVLLAWDAAGGNKVGSSGLLRMLEPVTTQTPTTTSCAGTNWSDPTAVTEVARFDVGNGLYELATVGFVDDTGVARTRADLCFAARGRSYLRTIGGFAALMGVVQFDVMNDTSKGGTGLRRTVFVPSSGVARVAQ